MDPEQESYQLGFQDGLTKGKSISTELCASMGLEQGLKMGENVGFYTAFATTVLCSSSISEKTSLLAHQLLQLSQDFPSENDQSRNLLLEHQKLNSKYKLLQSHLKKQALISTDTS